MQELDDQAKQLVRAAFEALNRQEGLKMSGVCLITLAKLGCEAPGLQLAPAAEAETDSAPIGESEVA